MNIERLPDGRSFVDDDGNIRHVSDLLTDMEPQTYDTGVVPEVTATRSLKQRRKHPRRGTEPLFSSDAARLIDEAQNAAEQRLERPLTTEELADIARQVEYKARGL